MAGAMGNVTLNFFYFLPVQKKTSFPLFFFPLTHPPSLLSVYITRRRKEEGKRRRSMQPIGVRRIRSSSTDHRRSSSDAGVGGGIAGGTSAGPAAGNSTQQRRTYDVDMTSLEKHRRLFAMERELQRWKEKAEVSTRDAKLREQELFRVKSEHAAVRQRLEHIIRDLLEKQKGFAEEMQKSRNEMELLRKDAAADNSALVAAQEAQLQLQRELEASKSHEAEVTGELSVVVEKLAKADTYIQTLSDEAVAYQLEIQRLQEQLDAAGEELQKKNKEREAEEKLRTSEELARRRKATRNLWTDLVNAALECADNCDSVSRECDEFIDVIKEEQQRVGQRQNIVRDGDGEKFMVTMPAAKTHPQAHVAFVSCKPTGEELERLLQVSLSSQRPGERDGDKMDDAVIWEGTTRVIARLLRGMQLALRETRDDVLVAGRAYAELCRAGRSMAEDLAELQAACAKERSTVVALEERLEHTQETLRIEKERADGLQASLDETAEIMAEAAALAEERTSRMEKLLRENNALEEALQMQRKSLRERDDAIAAVELKLRTLQDTMRREKNEWYSMHEELHRTKLAVKTALEERDTARSQLHELEQNIQALKEESQQCDVNCRYLGKCVEELQGQLAQVKKDRDLLRETKDSVEVERRRLLTQIDCLKRSGNTAACVTDSAPASRGSGGGGEFYSSVLFSPTVQRWKVPHGGKDVEASGENRHDAGSLLQSSERKEPVDKVRWWEAKLQAITSSMSSTMPLVATPSACRKDEKSGLMDNLQLLETNSATLASLAYGNSPPSQKLKDNSVPI
ncbi:hypothetical protein TCSYLVIO_007087 [Trypanosoma cruzi]|nr:hypothetical protein TCSYLVIO_007087 [Trypanosoma cruzi]